jgi:hypothetical protein
LRQAAVAALVGGAALAIPPAWAGDSPPIIERHPTANYDQGDAGLAFNVKVRKHPDSVHVVYEGQTLAAHEVANLSHWWETPLISAPLQDCYRIRVRAVNENGKARRDLRAGRLGTPGCE